MSSRGVPAVILGIATISASLVGYYTNLFLIPPLSAEIIQTLEKFAYISLILFAVGMVGLGYGVSEILKDVAAVFKESGKNPQSAFSMISYIICEKPYSQILAVSGIMYGLFYSFVTGIMVYQPSMKLSVDYLVKIPSAIIIPCCGPIGQVPVLVVYATDHLGFLIIPVNIILLFTVSWLVGLNMALSVFAFRNRPQDAGGRWLSGFGGLVSLFTGCPTCAGAFLAGMIGGAGATSIATALAPLQALFIALGIPVLLITPFLMATKLVKGFRECFPIGRKGL